jgi:ribosomal protein L2
LCFIKKTTRHFVGLFKFIDGSILPYKLASGLFIGDYVKNLFQPISYFRKFLLGCQTYLLSVMEYFFIYNISMSFLFYANYATSSGVFCQIISFLKELELVLLILPSKKRKYFNIFSFCVLGRNSNYLNKYSVIGSAK